MNTVKNAMKRLFLPLCLLLVQPAWAQNAIEALGVSQQGSDILVKLTTSQPLASAPASFSVANPPRIAFDFPGVKTRWAGILKPSTKAISAASVWSRSAIVRASC